MTQANAGPGNGDRVLELRQYTLKPGSRDTLIDLFDARLVEPQEEAGMRIVGQFRDLDDPDRFVWLRSFADMRSRERALAAFYGGPVWKAHRDEANATMVDSSNVLLLRPARPDAGLGVPARPRPAPGAARRSASLVVATLCQLPGPADEKLIEFVAEEVLPAAARVGALPAGLLATEPADNTFPPLPVREGVHVLVWLCLFEQPERHMDYLRLLDGGEHSLLRRLTPRVIAAPEHLRLAPTSRSALR